MHPVGGVPEEALAAVVHREPHLDVAPGQGEDVAHFVLLVFHDRLLVAPHGHFAEHALGVAGFGRRLGLGGTPELAHGVAEFVLLALGPVDDGAAQRQPGDGGGDEDQPDGQDAEDGTHGHLRWKYGRSRVPPATIIAAACEDRMKSRRNRGEFGTARFTTENAADIKGLLGFH